MDENLNTTKPLVSVNMPVFNGEKYISESIDSILAQTYQHFELIIVNDGSTDGTLQIIKKYTDDRIKLINHPQNLGLAVARNKGLEVSRGKYIAILDSDDIALPIRLEEQVNFMESNLDFGLIGSQVQPIDSIGQVCGNVWEYSYPAEQIPIYLLFNNCFAQSAILLRRSCLPKEWYRQCFPPAEDYDLWIRIAQKSKVWNLPKILTKYRLHENNISKTKNHIMNLAENKIIQWQLENLGIHPSEKEIEQHKKILINIMPIFATDAIILHNWLNILLATNAKTGIYNHSLFFSFLEGVWEKYFNKLLNFNFALLQTLINSPFPILASLPLKHKAIIFLKCAVRWKTRI